jgi:hypothetical protein
MTRSQIISSFRAENKEFPANVISDTVLNSWALAGDKIVCALSRCIVGDTVFNSVATTSVYNTKYDLTNLISKFQDIDEYPGGGVSFNNKPLDSTTVSELDEETPNWRTRSAGIPLKYYRRGKFLYFDRPVATADLEIRVYTVLVSDDFDNDNKTPFNQLSFLEPYHNAINKYLQWQAKISKAEPQDAQKSEKDFYDFISMMKKNLSGGKYGSIRFQPKTGYNQ